MVTDVATESHAVSIMLDTLQWASEVLKKQPARHEDVARICKQEHDRAAGMLGLAGAGRFSR